MKTGFLLLTFLTLNLSESNVYICGPTGAKKYHYTNNCRGLNSCSHGIKKVSISEAKSYGLTLCGWED